MSKKPRGLGSGFAALISQTSVVTQVPQQDSLLTLPIDQLMSGQFQPRTQWDEARLQELAESIRSQGIVQPIVVRAVSPQQYEIIAGERRWRAARMAGLQAVPVVVKKMDDQAAMAVALIENIQRQDLSAIEEARAIKKLIDNFSLTHEQIAQILGRSRESISNLLRLLRLTSTVQEAVLEGLLSAGHARALLSLSNELDQQRLAQQAMSLNWSVREVEQAVKNELNPLEVTEMNKNKDVELSVEMKALQEQASQKIGGHVKLKISPKGNGKIEIPFANQEELQRIMSIF
jgi:ParB family chromosome partitioning protein